MDYRRYMSDPPGEPVSNGNPGHRREVGHESRWDREPFPEEVAVVGKVSKELPAIVVDLLDFEGDWKLDSH